MSDITTVEEVSAGDYTVRVAQAQGGYEACVIAPDGDAAGQHMTVMGVNMAMHHTGESASADGDYPGPAVCAPHKWVAVGFAIEAYEWRHTEKEVAVEDGYNRVEIDADGLAEELDADFPGPWDPGDGGDNGGAGA